VGAFSLLARERAEQGCSSVALSLVTRPACDEVRHAEVCCRFAVALMGERELPARFRGLPNVPMHEGVTRAERGLYRISRARAGPTPCPRKLLDGTQRVVRRHSRLR